MSESTTISANTGFALSHVQFIMNFWNDKYFSDILQDSFNKVSTHCTASTFAVREVSRHFRNKKKAYLRAKIEELETNNKIQNIRDLYRGISDFKKGYQPRCYIVKDEKGDLVADSHGILARWRKYFSQLFNVHGVKDVGQAEIHTAEPLVPEPSASEVELAIDKLKVTNRQVLTKYRQN